jgi:hypothetical protein
MARRFAQFIHLHQRLPTRLATTDPHSDSLSVSHLYITHGSAVGDKAFLEAKIHGRYRRPVFQGPSRGGNPISRQLRDGIRPVSAVFALPVFCSLDLVPDFAFPVSIFVFSFLFSVIPNSNRKAF